MDPRYLDNNLYTPLSHEQCDEICDIFVPITSRKMYVWDGKNVGRCNMFVNLMRDLHGFEFVYEGHTCSWPFATERYGGLRIPCHKGETSEVFLVDLPGFILVDLYEYMVKPHKMLRKRVRNEMEV